MSRLHIYTLAACFALVACGGLDDPQSTAGGKADLIPAPLSGGGDPAVVHRPEGQDCRMVRLVGMPGSGTWMTDYDKITWEKYESAQWSTLVPSTGETMPAGVVGADAPTLLLDGFFPNNIFELSAEMWGFGQYGRAYVIRHEQTRFDDRQCRTHAGDVAKPVSAVAFFFARGVQQPLYRGQTYHCPKVETITSDLFTAIQMGGQAAQGGCFWLDGRHLDDNYNEGYNGQLDAPSADLSEAWFF